MKKRFLFYFIILLISAISYQPLGSAPKKAERLYQQGESAFKEQKYVSALNFYRSALKTNPYFREAKVGMAKAFYQLKIYDKAYKYYKMAEAQFKNDFRIKIGLAKVQLERGRFDSAESYLIKLFELKPREYEIYIVYGDIFVKKQNYNKAIKYYKEARDINPKKVIAYLKIGQSYLSLNKSSKAIAYLQQAEDIDNKSPLTNFYLGDYYFKQKDFGTSENFLKRSLSISKTYIPTMDILYRVLYEMEKFNESKDLLKKLVAMQPSVIKYYYQLGLAYEKVGQPEKAMTIMLDGMKLDLGNEAIRFQAERIFHKYYWTNPSVRHLGVNLANYWYNKGKIYLAQNLTDHAIFCFRRGIRQDPNHWKIRLKLSQIYKLKGFTNVYYNELKLIKSLNPTNQDINDRILFAERSMKRLLSIRESKRLDLKSQYDAPKTKPKIALLYFEKNHDFNHHYEIEKAFREILYTTLKMKYRLNVLLVDEKRKFQNEEQVAKSEGADFIIKGTVTEKSKLLKVTLTIFNLVDGGIYKTIKVSQRGSDRFITSALYLADQVEKLFPVLGQIIRKNHKDLFLNVGKRHHYKKGDRFFVIPSKKALTKLLSKKNLFKIITQKKLLKQILSTYLNNPRTGRLQEIEITQLDENIAKGKLITPDFFNEVTINNYVIQKPK